MYCLTAELMGHSVKGHNGILLPSMLIFTAWADLLFFLISVNFRICLSSRLTPFLEVPWNLKIKLIITTEKKQSPRGPRQAAHARLHLSKELGEPLGPAGLSFPRQGKSFPQYLQGPGRGSGTHSHHSAGSITV